MKYPGYLLNPGDMFQVDPERVMFATGASKDSSDLSSAEDVPNARSEDVDDAAAASIDQTEEPTKEEEEADDDEGEDPRKVLKSLLAQAKSIIAHPKGGKLSAKEKQHLRGFQKQIKRQLSRRDSSTTISDDLEAQFQELKNQLQRQPNLPPSAQQKDPSSSAAEQAEPTTTTTKTPFPPSASEAEAEEEDLDQLTPSDLDLLRTALSRLHLNPIDPTKPYATPWTPRPYMSAFAFIPPFLEVNQNICAAVYLRHPVARPGTAEVPTPFAEVTGGNAFAWYLRRR